jgi:hypothetical protein
MNARCQRDNQVQMAVKVGSLTGSKDMAGCDALESKTSNCRDHQEQGQLQTHNLGDFGDGRTFEPTIH